MDIFSRDNRYCRTQNIENRKHFSSLKKQQTLAISKQIKQLKIFKLSSLLNTACLLKPDFGMCAILEFAPKLSIQQYYYMFHHFMLLLSPTSHCFGRRHANASHYRSLGLNFGMRQQLCGESTQHPCAGVMDMSMYNLFVNEKYEYVSFIVRFASLCFTEHTEVHIIRIKMSSFYLILLCNELYSLVSLAQKRIIYL